MDGLHSVASILLKCRKGKNLTYARNVHARICPSGTGSYGNYTVPMYVDCGSVFHAQYSFDNLLDRTEHSWTNLIFGYIGHGQLQHALSLYPKMQEDNVCPSSFTYMALLRACTRLKDIEKGRQIHTVIKEKELVIDPFVGNTLVDMYAKCGSLKEAEEAFDSLPSQSLMAWTTLITGYAENGAGEEALRCFRQMKQEGFSPDPVSLTCCLRACGSLKAIENGREIHAEISERGYETYPSVANSLIDMYAKCGSLADAREVFNKLPLRDVVAWTTIIAGYTEHGCEKEAINCFEQMQMKGVSPDPVTFICSLKACTGMQDLNKGREIHSTVIKKGYEGYPVVGNILIDMYAKCGALTDAQKVFNNLPIQNVVSWTSLLRAYMATKYSKEIIDFLKKMQLQGVNLDAGALLCSLKACGNTGALDVGRELHFEIAQKGLKHDPVVGCALLDMYCKCGAMMSAREIFDKLSIRNIVSWTALIEGYTENGLGQEALRCFQQMQLEGILPNAVTFVSSLKACGSIGAVDKGREIHMQIKSMEFQADLFVGNSLIDMYAKCGELVEAREVFDKLEVRDVASWNAMIRGYGMNHEWPTAMQCFWNMQKQGIRPDAITFICLLTASSRANLIINCCEYLKMMKEEHGIKLTVDHYTCIVDLLARSGHLIGAEVFLDNELCSLSKGPWIALLSACKTFGEVEIGERCFQRLTHINSEHAATYVLMADIYASAGRLVDANRLEQLRNLGTKKKPTR